MKKMSCLVAFLGLLLLSACGSAEVRPAPVLTVEPILDRLGYAFTHFSLSLQHRVISELVQQYDCTVLSRSRGLSLGLDRAVSAMPPAQLPIPQYSIGGANVFGPILGNGWRRGDTELVIEELGRNRLYREVLSGSAGEVDEAARLVPRIAAQLKLQPRSDSRNATPRSRAGETWAVMPLAVLAELSDLDRPPDTDDCRALEFALQESRALKALVARDEVLKLLREHHLTSVNALTSGDWAGLGRVLSADAVVTGVISPGNRADLLLVDSRTGVVLGALTTEPAALADPARCAQLAQQLLALAPPPASDSAPSDSRAMAHEAKRLLDTIKSAAVFIRKNSGLSAQIITLAESYYLLKQSDERAVVELLEELFTNLLADKNDLKRCFLPNCPIRDTITVTRQQQEQLANLAFFMLDSLPEKTRSEARALRLRAVYALYGGMPENAGQYLTAWANADPRRARSREMLEHQAFLAVAQKDWLRAQAAFRRLNAPPDVLICGVLANTPRESWQEAREDLGWQWNCNPEALWLLLKLEEEYGSPASALDWLTRFQAKNSAANTMMRQQIPALRLQMAALCYRTGKFRQAKQLLETMKRVGDLYPVERRTYDALLADLRAKPEDQLREDPDFTPIGPLFAAFGGYKIYLQPDDKVDINALHEAAGLIRRHSGIEAVVLPPRPLPLEAYDRGRHQFSAQAVIRRLRGRSDGAARDGVLYLGVTGEPIFSSSTPRLRYVFYHYGREPGGAALFSGANGTQNLAIGTAVVALRLAAMLSRPENCCAAPPCFMTSLASGELKSLDFVACRRCAEYQKDLDPSVANRLFNQ